MKIAIINTLYAPNKVGGAEKSVQTLAENFSDLGNEVIVICLGKEDANYKLNGVIIHAVKIKNDFWPFEINNKNSFHKLIWHLKDASNNKYNDFLHHLFLDYKPDVLLTNNISGFSTKVWRIASNLNIKIVHTLRDYYLQCPKSTKFKNGLNCSNLCNDCNFLSIPKKKDSSKVKYLIGISNYILSDHIDKGYFKGVQNEVIFNEFAPRPHNSGHYTMDGCNVSQFKNHVLAITGNHIIKPVLKSNTVMINVLGQNQSYYSNSKDFTDAIIHDYFKSSNRENRKIGHINITYQNNEKLQVIIDNIIKE